MEILYSNPAVSDATINESSIVLRMNYNLVSFLFTGDEEGKYRPVGGYNDPDYPMKVEKYMLDHYVDENTNKLRSTIIKIPHHGSETSSTTPFIKAVGAKEGIICAGNRHGLPDESVIKRYENNGCRVWRTDRMDKGKRAAECHGDDTVIITTNGIDYNIRYKNIDPRDAEALERKRREDAKRKRTALVAPEAERKSGKKVPIAGGSAADKEPVLNTLD
ncbi:MAG: hypothetical protein RAO92_08420 [Candidatus Euphemobacter frigidus]|nr:hypothetical protein [Candidatus Euphemobacter frigidus]MDP8276411.1 hypothetical protein [Candidatus Euphemobacter frigidus]